MARDFLCPVHYLAVAASRVMSRWNLVWTYKVEPSNEARRETVAAKMAAALVSGRAAWCWYCFFLMQFVFSFTSSVVTIVSHEPHTISQPSYELAKCRLDFGLQNRLSFRNRDPRLPKAKLSQNADQFGRLVYMVSADILSRELRPRY
jgi:hypothetical protein